MSCSSIAFLLGAVRFYQMPAGAPPPGALTLAAIGGIGVAHD
jgi:hypothetical protein